jgi:hypothetical protein
VGAVPRLCELYPDICLKTEERVRKTSVRVAARISQAEIVKYKKMNSTIHRKKQQHKVVQFHRKIKNTEHTTEKKVHIR